MDEKKISTIKSAARKNLKWLNEALKGGPGSGNWGHGGLAGVWGGSSPRGGSNRGGRFLRYGSSRTPMSDWGHAMFKDASINPNHLEGTPSSMGRYEFVADSDDDRVVDSTSEEFRTAVENAFLEDVARGYYYGDVNGEMQNFIDMYESGELTMDGFLDLYSPPNIVDSAGAYDHLAGSGWLYERVMEAQGWGAVVTPDGAVVFDEDMITRIGNDD